MTVEKVSPTVALVMLVLFACFIVVALVVVVLPGGMRNSFSSPVSRGSAVRSLPETPGTPSPSPEGVLPVWPGTPPLWLEGVPPAQSGPSFSADRRDLPVAATEFGIQVDGWVPEPELVRSMQMIRDAGLTWVKYQVRWEMVEPSPYDYRWDELDRAVRVAGEYGLKVMLSVTSTPEWARVHPDAKRPLNPGWYGLFLYQVARRYQGNIHAIELYNEPNISMEFGRLIDPSAYAAMVEWGTVARYPDERVVLISAGLAPTEWKSPYDSMPDDVFLQELKDLGVLDRVDCVGVHFNHGVESPLREGGQWETLYRRYRSITDRPLCLTECGFAVPRGQVYPGFEWASDNTEEEQAQYLVDMVHWARRHPGELWLVIFWNWNYAYPGYPNEMYALYDPATGSVRPAYDALRRVLGSP